MSCHLSELPPFSSCYLSSSILLAKICYIIWGGPNVIWMCGSPCSKLTQISRQRQQSIKAKWALASLGPWVTACLPWSEPCVLSDSLPAMKWARCPMTLGRVCTITSGKTPCLRVSSTSFYLDSSLSLEKESPMFRIECYSVLGPARIQNLPVLWGLGILLGKLKNFEQWRDVVQCAC